MNLDLQTVNRYSIELGKMPELRVDSWVAPCVFHQFLCQASVDDRKQSQRVEHGLISHGSSAKAVLRWDTFRSQVGRRLPDIVHTGAYF